MKNQICAGLLWAASCVVGAAPGA
ncbi:hypothetical protein A2U01_0075265, partial [Trifolium medium]|nr:hypothetical protein [Trifolium medium]